MHAARVVETSDRGVLSPPQDVLTIGEMARRFGVSLRALRFYEDRGLLRPRRTGNSRFYGAKDRHRLDLILKGKRLGFTLTEIRDFIAREGERAAEPETAVLPLSAEQIAAQIDHLQRQRASLDEAIRELVARKARLGVAA